jgi:hypothetical protein
MDPLWVIAAQSLIPQLANGECRVKKVKLTEIQKVLQIPNALVYLASLATEQNNAHPYTREQMEWFRSLQLAYRKESSLLKQIYHLSPNLMPDNKTRQMIRRVVLTRCREIEVKAAKAEIRILSAINSTETKRREIKTQRCSGEANHPHLSYDKTEISNLEEESLVIKSEIKELEPVTHRLDDIKDATSINEIHQENLHEYPLQVNFSSQSNAKVESPIDSVIIQPRIEEEEDSFSCRLENSNLKAAENFEAHINGLRKRILSLELELMTKEEEIRNVKEASARSIQTEMERSQERLQALQLRLYISETRCKIFEDALHQHMEAVTGNVSFGSLNRWCLRDENEERETAILPLYSRAPNVQESVSVTQGSSERK